MDRSAGRTVVEHNGVTTIIDGDVDVEHLLVAVAADTGKKLWSVATGPGYTASASALETIGQFRNQLVVVDDTVVIGSGGVAGFAA